MNEWNPGAPTAADYAVDNATQARRKAEALELRVARLEAAHHGPRSAFVCADPPCQVAVERAGDLCGRHSPGTVRDTNDNPVVNWQRSDGPTCLVFGPRTGRAPLLMIVLGDTLEARYDPADLDEAARVFIERVNEMLGR